MGKKGNIGGQAKTRKNVFKMLGRAYNCRGPTERQNKEEGRFLTSAEKTSKENAVESSGGGMLYLYPFKNLRALQRVSEEGKGSLSGEEKEKITVASKREGKGSGMLFLSPERQE